MPNISQLKQSKFLRKDDVGEEGTVVTIVNVHETNVAMENEAPEMRWVLVTREFTRPLVLNSTNAQLIAKFLGSDETDDWAGKQVVLYDEPNVSYSGKLVGGIRVRRAPAPGKASGPRLVAARPTPPEDDVPWGNE